MNLFENTKILLALSSNDFILGLSILEIIIIIFAIFVPFIIKNFFAKFIVRRLKLVITKSNDDLEDKLFDAIESPFKLLPFILSLIFVLLSIEFNSKLTLYLEKLTLSLFTIFIFLLIHQSLELILQIFETFKKMFTKSFFVWFSKSLKFLIIFLAIVAVLETWGIKIGPVIAGLGLFGVAVALGAQDLFKNLISGILIILENRFQIGDVIELPNHAVGTVEQIGFRSTLIRKFDSSPVSIPNYVFSESSLINFSLRPYRKINWLIGLTYGSTIDQLKKICLDIDNYLRNCPDFMVNENFKAITRVEKFNDSSIDILIQVFTINNDWEYYLELKRNWP